MGTPEKIGVFEDPQGRIYRKLRLSVTDRCQFRCHYCMPDGPVEGEWLPRQELLSYEDLTQFVQWTVDTCGIRDIRLTGGEPLLRRSLHELVRTIKQACPNVRVQMTTNASQLEGQLDDLLAAGLAGITISLDSLDSKRFSELNGVPPATLANVTRSIALVAEKPDLIRKLNTVIVRDRNDLEIPELIRFAAENRSQIRFIEYMPFGQRWSNSDIVFEKEILKIVQDAFGEIKPVKHPKSATAWTYTLPKFNNYSFGIVPTMSGKLCGECDRLRLTADGRLLNCLFDQKGTPIADLIREQDFSAIFPRISDHLAQKGDGYLADQKRIASEKLLGHMHAVGG